MLYCATLTCSNTVPTHNNKEQPCYFCSEIADYGRLLVASWKQSLLAEYGPLQEELPAPKKEQLAQIEGLLLTYQEKLAPLRSRKQILTLLLAAIPDPRVLTNLAPFQKLSQLKLSFLTLLAAHCYYTLTGEVKTPARLSVKNFVH